MSAPATATDQTGCANCTTHECGLLYAECACCAARAAAPGDVTLGAAAVAILDDRPDDVDTDDEEFCPDCRAGTTSSEHHEKCETEVDLGLDDYIPYEGKTIREIIDDYVLVRGDLVDRDYPHAREQLTKVIEDRIRRAVTARVEAVITALDEASRFGYLEESNPGGEEPIRNHGYFIEVDDLTRIARETTS